MRPWAVPSTGGGRALWGEPIGGRFHAFSPPRDACGCSTARNGRATLVKGMGRSPLNARALPKGHLLVSRDGVVCVERVPLPVAVWHGSTRSPLRDTREGRRPTFCFREASHALQL
jgi:hypothetical protein